MSEEESGKLTNKSELEALVARLEKLEQENAALRAKVGAMEIAGNKGYGIGTVEEARLGKGKPTTGDLAIARATVPKWITDEMEQRVSTKEIQEIVKAAKR
jgi:hypothetical protein